jgi:transposase
LLGVLLQTSGWLPRAPLTGLLVLLPVAQACLWRRAGTARRGSRARTAAALLQRLYQLSLGLLLVGSLVHGWNGRALACEGWLTPLGLSAGVLPADDSPTEVHIAPTGERQYTVSLRGAFTLDWQARDTFERWMLILFLRRLHRPGDERPWLTQPRLAEAFDTSQTEVSRWERAVQQHGWHLLSDRFRHQVNSLLPQPELSRAILKVWAPAFWLSAWQVRERLIQLGLVANRAALHLEALHALAKHTGFAQVRDLLLERFDLQAGRLLAKDHWWLAELLALNERLLGQLERGERLTPQALVEIEPLRLKTPEKPADSACPPLAAALRPTLGDRPPLTATTCVRCVYCGSDQVAPKSKQARERRVIDEFGETHSLQVVRYYCHNPACAYQTFTHLPAGVWSHSPYPLRVRLLAVQVYEGLLATYRRSARVLGVSAATVYGWLADLSPAALHLAAYLGVVRTSGVIGLDDKWVKVCSPSAVRPHGRRPRAVWRYAYFAVDAYTYDLLALELYPEHNDEAVRRLLLELKAQGLRPRVVVSDLDPAYGRVLPHVFPAAVHHECIFHAVQNALDQLTRVYGRNYLEQVPTTAPLHEAVTQLFRAQTQKTVRQRFADLLALRPTYVAQTPEVACVFDSLERHFPKLVNAIEHPLIPRTNNTTELVIRRFDQHYQTMCGFDSVDSARVYLRLFQLTYRLTPFVDDNPTAIAGKCPLELAGYDLQALPIADFFLNLKLPALVPSAPEAVPMA